MTPGQMSNLERLEKLEAVVSAQASDLAELKRIIAGIGAVFGGGGAEIADDDELDSKFGNAPVAKDPTDRFWKGPRFVGKRLSECSPEYLDALAKYKDVCAKLKEKDGGEAKLKYASYDRADAARARGWARRLRAGWTPPTPPERPAFAGGAHGGSGFGSGGSSSFGRPGGGFLGDRDAKPVNEPEPSSAPEAPQAMADDDFPFGANAEPASVPLPVAPDAPPANDEQDDDPPL